MLGLGVLALLPLVAAKGLRARNTACNNSPDLCNKSYGEITHLGAHDSPFVRDASTDYSTSGDQYYNTKDQLSAGVRLVTGQIYKKDSAWHLCHSNCELLDAGTLSSWLGDIKSWMDSNPNEVVTILLVNSDGASASDIKSQYESSGINKYAYTPASASAAWPTLQKMIDDGTRLVTFVASLSGTAQGASYLLNEWDYVWENPYDVTSASNFSCTPDRPTSVQGDISAAIQSGKLPLMNHFLYQTGILDIQTPNSSYVGTTNAPSGGTGNLGDTASDCKKQYGGRQPTFILVDFFNKGPAIETVDNLNNVTNAVGRKELSSSATSGGSTTNNVFKGLIEMANKARSGDSPSMGDWVWVGGEWGSLLGGGINLS